VPLLFWAGQALPPATIGDVVGLADVAPTLLDLVGLPPIEGLDGTSLAAYFRGPSEPLHDAVHAERIRYVWEPDAPQIHAIVTQARRKLIRQAADEQAFDLEQDVCEARSLPEVPGDLRSALDAWLGAQTEAATAFVRRFGAASRAIDAEDVEQLKALGYVE
jgi:arylsulfatase A-like enzyme